jgi:hypothetical protein
VQTILWQCRTRALRQRKASAHYVPEAQSSKQAGGIIYTFYGGDHLLWGKVISCSSMTSSLTIMKRN